MHPFERTALLAAREDRPLVHICLRTGTGRPNALKKSPPCSRKPFAFHFYKLWTRAENKLQKSSGKWQVLAVPGSGGHWPKEMGCHQKKFKVLIRNHAHFYSVLREALDTEGKVTEREVNCMEATQMLCSLSEAIKVPQQHLVLQSCCNAAYNR